MSSPYPYAVNFNDPTAVTDGVVRKKAPHPLAGFGTRSLPPEVDPDTTIDANVGRSELENVISADPAQFIKNSNNPHVGEMETLSNEISGIQRRGMADAQAPVSGGRKLAGILAGFGMGAISGNPLAGYGMYDLITKAPQEAALQKMKMQSAPMEAQYGREKDIAAAQSTTQERAAQTEAAVAAGQGHQVKAAQDIYEREHPELNAPTDAGDRSIQTPKRFGSLPGGRQTIDVGPASSKSKPEYKTDKKGNLYAVTGNEGSVVKDSSGKPIQMAPEDAKAFNEYIQNFRTAHPSASPDEENKAIEQFLKAGAVNFGETNIPRQQEVTEQHSAAVSEVVSRVQKALANDPVIKDDPNAYKAKVEEWLQKVQAGAPSWARYINDARTQLLKGTPSRPPQKKQGINLSDVLPKNTPPKK